jgi:hypothetical protein
MHFCNILTRFTNSFPHFARSGDSDGAICCHRAPIFLSALLPHFFCVSHRFCLQVLTWLFPFCRSRSFRSGCSVRLRSSRARYCHLFSRQPLQTTTLPFTLHTSLQLSLSHFTLHTSLHSLSHSHFTLHFTPFPIHTSHFTSLTEFPFTCHSKAEFFPPPSPSISYQAGAVRAVLRGPWHGQHHLHSTHALNLS